MILSTNVIKSTFASTSKNLAVAIALCTAIVLPPAVLSETTAASDANDPVAIYKEVGISSEQESSIRKMAQDYDQENSVRLQSLGQMLQELKDMAYQTVLNETAMLAKQDDINKLQSEMARQRIKLVIKIRGVLTPAQNEKLVAALQSRTRPEEPVKLR